jgi:hypothetical protein
MIQRERLPKALRPWRIFLRVTVLPEGCERKRTATTPWNFTLIRAANTSPNTSQPRDTVTDNSHTQKHVQMDSAARII